ncbi:Type II secretion system protein J precursor [Escherichia coli]|uniref:type II secretion system minor pseudopilin GspJ n=1 Tax=Escherichia coli TaxID=562 RepID=UPI000E1CCF83|nr:type II secretion system minor pseudopilin GspJ [Escherichia coli]EFN8783097.1 type II secretion system protein GspJ [Escherichia coli]RDP35589.1 Type II secretion system protein J precursor [Escherichia coli]HBA9675063.1 type II secretion system minor pseudopilin GspJ [Escherichia coli]HBB0203955.1 type II secretion system minor pseudopilin GspJ [Escherichia coli]
MSQQRVKGFTLLEMLLALAVFAALSISAFQVLQGGIRAHELSLDKVRRLAELQRGVSQMERDLTQMIPRHSRGNEGQLLAAPHLLKSDDWGISFTRNSWLNPAGMLPRSELQWVGYRLRQQKLERLSYFHVDHPSGVSPDVKVMLDGVHAFRLRFFVNGAWQARWESTGILPQAVEVTLVMDDFAELTRLFLVSKETAE